MAVVPSLGETARFLFHFLKHPVSTGAIVPSSRYLAAHMVEGMGLREASTVVEIGPGTGAFTGAIVSEIGPQTLLLAVELNATFAMQLAAKFPGISVINDSAENLRRHLVERGRPAADRILCSLPWAGFPEDVQQRLMKAIVEPLAPGGRFATFAYVHAAWLPAARRFRQMLEAHFRDVQTTRVVWRNVPPAVVYRCDK